MASKTNVITLFFFLAVFSVSAFHNKTVNDKPLLGIFLGFEENKGYTFTITEGLQAKIITFGEIKDSTVINKYNLKDNTTVGTSFNLIYEEGLNEETGGLNLDLVSLEKTEKPDTLLEKHN